jgi:undecaprenyl-phosphate 4-deoxy-4-formamido-L-arabinose transferase
MQMATQISAPAMKVNSLSVVIPVYNGAVGLPHLIERLQPVLKEQAARAEVVLVNDGSRDHSWQVICDLAAEHDWVCGINLMRNYGQHNALLCGIRAAKYEIIVTMDDDLQHPPEEIHKLLSNLSEGYDVVYGTPLKEQHGIWRDLASRVTKLVLQNAMRADIARNVSAFRALRTQVRDAFLAYQSPFVSIDVLLTWGTTSFTAVPVRHDPRSDGVSNYTLRKLIIHAINMMTGFSTLPLQLASIIGFSFTLFGMGVLVYVIGVYMVYGDKVPGFPFLASVISIFSGAQLFALGIMGEYLSRIHFRTMDRPAYTVRSATNTDSDS